MKKASRFAALLAAVMLFGSVAAMPALAEDATSTPVPTATAEPTVTPAPTDNGQSAPNNSGSAYIIAQTVTDAAGGEITTIDRDSRFNLILRVADYGAYNNFIPADQISARINSSAFTFTGNAEVGQLYEETDANGAGYYSYVLLFRDVIYNGGGNSVPINLSYLNSTMAMQQLSVTLGQCVDEDPDTPNLMIRASSYGNEAVVAGTPFTLTLTLYATGGQENLNDVVISLTLPDGTVLRVQDVHEQAGILWHTVDALPAAAAPGAAVAGCIDWDWRFDKMQQHTGEHILSGILHQMFGAENVGFHVGTEAVRMDTSVPISPEGLRQAELAANRIVWQDVPVLVSYPTREELAALVYRSKKEIEGQVRIVTIPGADVCACCGTHTRTTGQVGQIKILASENYKGGVRLSVVCGARALTAAQAMRARQADIGALLSAKADQTAVAVHRVYDEYTALKFTHFGLCSQLFDALAQLTAPDADAIRTLPGLDPDGLHRLAVRLTEATTGLCAALTPTEKGTGYCLAQRDGDVRALTKALNAALNGRGGGKPGICQGSCAATPEQVERFLKENNKL